MAIILKWDVDKIYLYPYGGLTKLNGDINKPLYEELLILIMGPIFQIIYYYIIINIVSDKTGLIFKNYHYAILIFNLLPILPLDGGKLLNIILEYFNPYLRSFNLTIIISFIFILSYIAISIYMKNDLNIILVLLIILGKLFQELKKRKHYFNKFLLERYLKKYNYNKLKTITNSKNMYRDYRHIFRIDNKYITEKEYLYLKYHNNRQ